LDSSGYTNEARLFARGRVSEEVLALIGPPPGGRLDAYIPLGYRVGRTTGTIPRAAPAASRSEGAPRYRDASRGAARLAPPHSVIAAMQMSGALVYYTDRAIVRWDRTTPEGFDELRRRARERGTSFWALLWPFEVAEFAARLPGDWAPAGRWGGVILYRLR
jgi:hypothetical protein